MTEYFKMQELMNEYGNAFYILDTKKFEDNFLALKNSFVEIYSNFNIAYSYKTNYIPKLCKKVNELGGFAEVVSEMELCLAKKVGVKTQDIIWNGPCKNVNVVRDLLIEGGTVNVDNFSELQQLLEISQKENKIFNVGIRCNFDIGDGVVSRFGFDLDNGDLLSAITMVGRSKNLCLKGLHCHFACRSIETWKARVTNMLSIIKTSRIIPEYIDLGGGLFGNMSESLKRQFGCKVPSYLEYAKVIATPFQEFFNGEVKPMLIIEPGTAVVSDCMSFVTKVTNIKDVRGKKIANVYGSIYNINPTLNNKNMPIEVLSADNSGEEYKDLSFSGYTCMECDYLYRHYNGRLKYGDVVVFHNVGSYSVVLKPPFLIPNFPVIEITESCVEVVKRKENFEDIFHTFIF